jgi:ADP-ribose pyrophosphatase YjhB (NUDIX family)
MGAVMKKTINNVTLCLLLKDGGVWLAMKKRGFAAGRWNGYGGKQNEGETVEEAAIRETFEESRLKIDIEKIMKVAVIDFFFSLKPEWDQRVHVYVVTEWQGEPVETEEMKPQFFAMDKLPESEMWLEDKLWLPRILKGEKLEGEIYFRDLEGNAEKVELRNTKSLM